MQFDQGYCYCWTGRIVLTLALSLCCMVICAGTGSGDGNETSEVEIISRFFTSVMDFNADLIVISERSQDCIELETRLSTNNSETLLSCYFSEDQDFRISSFQSQHTGIIFVNAVVINSTVLHQLGHTLKSYKSRFRVKPYVFLTTWDEVNRSEINFFEDTFVLDTDIYIFNYKSEEIFEIYVRKRILIVRKIPKTKKGFYFLNDKVKRRSNLMGSQVVANTVDSASYYNWVKLSTTTNGSSGFSISIYNDLKVMLNFTWAAFAVQIASGMIDFLRITGIRICTMRKFPPRGKQACLAELSHLTLGGNFALYKLNSDNISCSPTSICLPPSPSEAWSFRRERIIIGDWIDNFPNLSLHGTTFDQLNSGEADISITQQGLIDYRAKQLQFLQPTYHGVMQAFFQQPETNAIRNIVTAPFQANLWICLAVTWFIVIISVKVMNQIKTLSCAENSAEDAHFAREALMWAIAATCQKSWYVHPTCTSAKMIFLIGYISGVVCFVAYSAAIVSALAVIITPVKGFMDLIAFKYIFTAHKSSASTIFLLGQLKDTFHLSQGIKTVGTESEISQLLETNPSNAFLSSEDNFYSEAVINYTKPFLCAHINKVPVGSVPLKTGMFLKKGSEMTELFNYKIIMLKERGFNLRYMQYYNKLTGLQCGSRDQLHQGGLSLKDIFTAFIIIIVGFATAFAIVVVEIIYAKYYYDKRK